MFKRWKYQDDKNDENSMWNLLLINMSIQSAFDIGFVVVEFTKRVIILQYDKHWYPDTKSVETDGNENYLPRYVKLKSIEKINLALFKFNNDKSYINAKMQLHTHRKFWQKWKHGKSRT
jgi:hypothetical protein